MSELDQQWTGLKKVFLQLFRIILANSIILDLFSGSGNLGLEALSQGAKNAYLVDANKKATNTIKKNIENIGISSAEVLTMDYKKALDYLKTKNIKFDVIS